MTSGQLSPWSGYVNACFLFRQLRLPQVRIAVVAKGEGPGKIFLVHGFSGDMNEARRKFIGSEVQAACLDQLIHRFPKIEAEYADTHIAPEPVICREPALSRAVLEFLKGSLGTAARLAESRGDFHALFGIKEKEARVINHLAACKSCRWLQRTFDAREENIPLPMTRILNAHIINRSNQLSSVRPC